MRQSAPRYHAESPQNAPGLSNVEYGPVAASKGHTDQIGMELVPLGPDFLLKLQKITKILVNFSNKSSFLENGSNDF